MVEEEKSVKPPFSTRDLYLASTLVTMKVPLIGIDYQQEGLKERMIGYFSFDDTEELRDIRARYNSGSILVEPRMFINNLQSLKADVMNFSMNPNSRLRK